MEFKPRNGRRRAGGARGAEARVQSQGKWKVDNHRRRQSKVAAIPGFVAPQLCLSRSRSLPEAGGWGHEIKLDGYRLQLRVEDGEVTLKTRKGLDWTEKFAAIAKEAGSLPDALIDGEVVALDAKGDPDFSALQAALSDGKTGNLIFFAFDLLFADEFDLRRSPLSERKRAVEGHAGRPRWRQGKPDPLPRSRRGRRRGGLANGLQDVAGRDHLEKAQRALSIRPIRKLDQDQVPRRP